MTEPAPTVSVGSIDGGLYLGLHGRSTHATCPTTDSLIHDYLASEPSSPTVLIDLAGCDWIDSTFAGWLAGLRKRLARLGAGRMCLLRCPDACRESLDRMNLASLFEFAEHEPPAEVREVSASVTTPPDRHALELMLQAHEQLAEIDARNARVFGPIADLLKEQLRTMDSLDGGALPH